ncbi:MAG: helix-turn-helix transcriptional regulator [Bdellovibrio sp.]|nr:helix-turn-helix transcriptional regulator [Bdellovibrio sp.]
MDEHNVFNMLTTILESKTRNAIMVDKAIFRYFATYLSPAIIEQFLEDSALIPPEIGSPLFKSWLATCRDKLDITQGELYEHTRIDQGDLSNFESGKKEFGLDRRRKILEYLEPMIKEYFRSKSFPSKSQAA